MGGLTRSFRPRVREKEHVFGYGKQKEGSIGVWPAVFRGWPRCGGLPRFLAWRSKKKKGKVGGKRMDVEKKTGTLVAQEQGNGRKALVSRMGKKEEKKGADQCDRKHSALRQRKRGKKGSLGLLSI